MIVKLFFLNVYKILSIRLSDSDTIFRLSKNKMLSNSFAKLVSPYFPSNNKANGEKRNIARNILTCTTWLQRVPLETALGYSKFWGQKIWNISNYFISPGNMKRLTLWRHHTCVPLDYKYNYLKKKIILVQVSYSNYCISIIICIFVISPTQHTFWPPQ